MSLHLRNDCITVSSHPRSLHPLTLFLLCLRLLLLLELSLVAVLLVTLSRYSSGGRGNGVISVS